MSWRILQFLCVGLLGLLGLFGWTVTMPPHGEAQDRVLYTSNPATRTEIPHLPSPLISEAEQIQILPDREYLKVIEQEIAAARKEILVGMYLFRIDDTRNNPANRLEKALEAAASRGVVVKVLLEQEEDSASSLSRQNAATAKRLRRHGVQTYFDLPKRRTHTKVLVIDRNRVFLGSHNFTRSALQFNHEISVMILSKTHAEAVANYIEGIIDEAAKVRHRDSGTDLFH